ncbi:UNVERIFIED_CONTAM: hypothetical protein FKN15_030746 [Acipenser sinensis]
MSLLFCHLSARLLLIAIRYLMQKPFKLCVSNLQILHGTKARRGRCVTVVCLPAMAKQNHGEYQRYGDTLHTVALAGASNNNENRRRKKKRK